MEKEQNVFIEKSERDLQIEKLKRFLQENYPNIQAFNTRNICGDYMVTVYNEDGIAVDYAPEYEYIEIFGLTEKEFNDLLNPKTRFTYLKTFKFDD